MEKIVIHRYEDFEKYAGQKLGVSGYHKITQEQINRFAEATLDYQWIHVDPARAVKESPYKKTIAHGYLNLAILPYLWVQIIEVKNITMMVNYGIENLKFKQPVFVDDEVRLAASLQSITNLRGIAKAIIHVVLEIKNSKKPALEATLIFLYHFKNG